MAASSIALTRADFTTYRQFSDTRDGRIRRDTRRATRASKRAWLEL